MNEWTQTAIVYINLVVTGSEAHNSRKASRGGGNLWIERRFNWCPPRLSPTRHVCEDPVADRQSEDLRQHLPVHLSPAPPWALQGRAGDPAPIRGPHRLQSSHEPRRATHRNGQRWVMKLSLSPSLSVSLSLSLSLSLKTHTDKETLKLSYFGIRWIPMTCVDAY